MSISSKNFDKEYYYNTCLGFEEFRASNGLLLNERVRELIYSFKLKKSMNVLEIGCGRGEMSLNIGKKVSSVIGIDYSRSAIQIANKIRKRYSLGIRKKVKFKVMRADALNFPDKSFDLIVIIDTIDHLNNVELKKTFKEVLRVLSPHGVIIIKTCSNKILLNKTYPLYILPINKIITFLDKKIRNINYESLPHNPRTKEANMQHVNEPDYFSLIKFFNIYNLKWRINTQTGFLTNNKGLRSKFYNFIVTLYPMSKYFPLNIFFAHSFIITLVRKNDNLIK